jgi:hypothetical protein
MSKPGVIPLYIATLSDLTGEECVRAFSRAATECRYFPSPAVLLELSGRPKAMPEPTEAMRKLMLIFTQMREYGPKLEPPQRKPIKQNDEHGIRLDRKDWVWSPEVLAPAFDDATEAAIRLVGFGERAAGLDALAGHPSLPWNRVSEALDASGASFRLRDAAKVEDRWAEAYSASRRVMA